MTFSISTIQMVIFLSVLKQIHWTDFNLSWKMQFFHSEKNVKKVNESQKQMHWKKVVFSGRLNNLTFSHQSNHRFNYAEICHDLTLWTKNWQNSENSKSKAKIQPNEKTHQKFQCLLKLPSMKQPLNCILFFTEDSSIFPIWSNEM